MPYLFIDRVISIILFLFLKEHKTNLFSNFSNEIVNSNTESN